MLNIILFYFDNRSGSECSFCLACHGGGVDGGSEVPGGDSERGEVRLHGQSH